MWHLFTSARFVLAALLVVLALSIRFLRRLHHQRSLLKGLPGPPHSYIWGSLRSMGEVISKQPKRCAPQTYATFVKERYNLGDYFYLDPWPLGDPILAIFDTDLMTECVVKHSLPKHPAIEEFIQHLGGPGNLVSAEGTEWKKWRSAFNPGFSAQHLVTLVPSIVDQCSIFCEIMTERAKKNELFRMEQAATKLTVDIIGKVILDLSFNSQKGPNELVDAFISQVQWIPIGAQFNPWELVDPRRPFMLRYNTWKMNRYISKALDERFATRTARGKTKHVIDLALEAYLKEVKGQSIDNVSELDKAFKGAAMNNMKIFIFAGHDTTSATICYAYYYLSKNPDMLALARKELDEVFGPEVNTVAEKIKQDPHLLNRLDYLLAVTKEVLRMQPPASTIRMGQKGFFLHDPTTGQPLPTEGMMVWPVDVGFGRSAKYWPNPHTFRPSRFLSPQSDPNTTQSPTDTYNKDAWIPFSKGPRNCIGQELALIETKIILAMTLRKFEFVPCFGRAELDVLKHDGSGYPSDSEGVQTQFGDEAYQIQRGTAKPREGMPCRLVLRE